MDPDDLITCCGTYCGLCARWKEFGALRDAAALLAELADAHGFQHWLPGAPAGFDYGEFRKGLDFFANRDSWFVCRTPCRQNTGGPPFCVRGCCAEHQVDVCWDCAEFPCAKLREGDQEQLRRLVDGAAEYRALGRDEWVRRRAEAAERGYEHHAGKCYVVTVREGDGPDGGAS